MYLLSFLIIFPAFAGILLLLTRNERIRCAIVKISSFALFGGSLILLGKNFTWNIQVFKAYSLIADKGMFLVELLLCGYILYAGIKYRRPLTVLFVSLQALFLSGFEFFYGRRNPTVYSLFMDDLSVLMAMIVGVIGGLICLYSLGHMKELYEKSDKRAKDNRSFFFFTIFIFLSAMYGVVFCNNLQWIYFFWEITTLCSFLLIGYDRTEEARKNSFLALEFNLLGGLAFLIAIIYLYLSAGITELDKLMQTPKITLMLPVALIVIAGLIKSAQMPFTSWLIGAMVAPVPASALLHASTMVKAGTYVMLRMATLLEHTIVGYLLALIGGITFVACAFIAVSEKQAKKVLAYSTVSNLGLIVLCAGVGTYEAMWAAMLLIVFHAVAKCLLFLCVGAVEQKINTMEIEYMSGLILRMPRTSIMMQIGMAGMFLAPFGMLIGKWATLKALVDYNPVLAIFAIFGSSITVFYWVKWMGKLITVERPYEDLEGGIPLSEWMPLYSLAGFSIGICFFFPLICDLFITPYLMEIYGTTLDIGRGNIMIMTLMLAMVLLFPLSFINYGKKVKVVDAYLGGANADSPTEFRSQGLSVKNMQMRNYYMDGYFSEAKLFRFGLLITAILLIAMMGVACVTLMY